MTKRKNNNGIFYVVISLVALVAIGTGVYAYSNSHNVNVGNGGVYNYNEAPDNVSLPDEEINLGGTIGSDVYNDVTFRGETQLTNPNATIEIPIQFRPTTTDASTPNYGVAGQYKNTGDPMLCTGPSVWLWDDAAKFSWSIGVTTTTNKDGLFLTGTTTRHLLGNTRIGTTTEDIGWDLFDGVNTSTEDLLMGTYFDGTANNSSTPWLLNTNDIIVVDITYEGATSTESFTQTPVDLTPGAVYFDCTNIY